MQIDISSKKECIHESVVGPSFEETRKLLSTINPKKAVMGNMSSDLMKLGEDSLVSMVHRCLYACFIQEDIPVQMKIEKIVLLYKNSGLLSDMDIHTYIHNYSIICTEINLYIQATDKHKAFFTYSPLSLVQENICPFFTPQTNILLVQQHVQLYQYHQPHHLHNTWS